MAAAEPAFAMHAFRMGPLETARNLKCQLLLLLLLQLPLTHQVQQLCSSGERDDPLPAPQCYLFPHQMYLLVSLDNSSLHNYINASALQLIP